MSLLLCFAGQIGAGKSSVSTAVAKALGWGRTGFGDYLRSEIARLGGDPDARQALQDLGQKRVDDDPVAFCRDVLSAAGFRSGDNFVIDGIRHIRIFEILATVSAPSHARLLFLGASQATLMSRIGARADAEDFSRASEHRVESELSDAVPQRADGVVSADQPFSCVLAECLNLIRNWQVTAN